MKDFIIFIISIISIVIFSACNKTGKQLKERIAGADSVAINYFKGDGTMDTVVEVKIIKDKHTLEQLTNVITESSTEIKNDCGFDGSIHYFKNNMVIQDIDFRMSDGCNQFSFSLHGKRVATKLSGEAITLLNAQRKFPAQTPGP